MFDDDIKIIEPDYWTFLYEEPNNGWWLKIDNANDLIDYHNKTVRRYQNVIEDYLKNAHEYQKEYRYDVFQHTLTFAIVRYAERHEIPIVDAAMQFRMKVAAEQLEAIHRYGYIVLNRAGGYHSGPIHYSQFVHRKTFTWPDFKESDIRIKQFDGGTHFYVHIGDMELHEGNDIKWMTRDEAYAAAMRYINKED